MEVGGLCMSSKRLFAPWSNQSISIRIQNVKKPWSVQPLTWSLSSDWYVFLLFCSLVWSQQLAASASTREDLVAKRNMVVHVLNLPSRSQGSSHASSTLLTLREMSWCSVVSAPTCLRGVAVSIELFTCSKFNELSGSAVDRIMFCQVYCISSVNIHISCCQYCVSESRSHIVIAQKQSLTWPELGQQWWLGAL